ncbi:MAG: ABC transporter substrate-binding protein, partial [Proteobacteria bacterium]|nr:ABC transporter substrate-binding protein [Pseudomonadota bacterium]
LTGPFKTESARWSQAASAMEKQINATGGIRGRQVKFPTYDCRYDVAVSTSILNQLINQKPKAPIFSGYIGHFFVASLPKMSQPGYRVPILAPASYEMFVNPPNWAFCFGILYAQSFGGFLDWQLQSWKEKRPIKAAFYTLDSPGGREPLKVKPYLESRGIEVVAVEFTKPNPVDITQIMMRYQQTQPDFIYCIAPVGAIAKLFNEVKKRKLKTKLVIPAFVTFGMLEKFVDKETLEGHYQSCAFNTYLDDEAPGIKAANELFKKYVPELGHPESIDMWSLGTTMLAKEVLERAYDQVGSWDKVDGDLAYKILENGKFSLGGITSDLEFSPTKRIGNNAFKVLQYRGGQAVDASGWLPISPGLKEDVLFKAKK